MLILIAGPYRSGTGDDPEKMAENVHFMESFALPIFRLGHIPVLGEWFALPLVELAGSKQVGDEAFNEVFHPIAERLLRKCDAVLRVGGASNGADLMVEVARRHSLQVYTRLEEYILDWKKFHRHNSSEEPPKNRSADAPVFIFYQFCPKCDNRHGYLSHS
jgi:hypothetical protein